MSSVRSLGIIHFLRTGFVHDYLLVQDVLIPCKIYSPVYTSFGNSTSQTSGSGLDKEFFLDQKFAF